MTTEELAEKLWRTRTRDPEKALRWDDLYDDVRGSWIAVARVAQAECGVSEDLREALDVIVAGTRGLTERSPALRSVALGDMAGLSPMRTEAAHRLHVAFEAARTGRTEPRGSSESIAIRYGVGLLDTVTFGIPARRVLADVLHDVMVALREHECVYGVDLPWLMEHRFRWTPHGSTAQLRKDGIYESKGGVLAPLGTVTARVRIAWYCTRHGVLGPSKDGEAPVCRGCTVDDGIAVGKVADDTCPKCHRPKGRDNATWVLPSCWAHRHSDSAMWMGDCDNAAKEWAAKHGAAPHGQLSATSTTFHPDDRIGPKVRTDAAPGVPDPQRHWHKDGSGDTDPSCPRARLLMVDWKCPAHGFIGRVPHGSNELACPSCLAPEPATPSDAVPMSPLAAEDVRVALMALGDAWTESAMTSGDMARVRTLIGRAMTSLGHPTDDGVLVDPVRAVHGQPQCIARHPHTRYWCGRAVNHDGQHVAWADDAVCERWPQFKETVIDKPLVPGDVVVLKSGEARGVAEAVDGDDVVVLWVGSMLPCRITVKAITLTRGP